MNKFKFIISIACFSLLFFVTSSAQAAIDGYLNVTSPNGGETYTEGDVVTITWDSSPNIDKIMIGYSSGPGNLNWIAFDTPNTGSYTWKVDVGNTTKESFVIDITGYDVGVGSISDKSDGWFTVKQKSEFPPAPAPETKTVPEVKTAPVVQTEPAPAPQPVEEVKKEEPVQSDPDPATVNISQTNILSITQIQINQYFYFENSKTTDLSIVDPEKVENFTLDRIDLMYFSFLGVTDLSQPEDAEVMENLDELVYLDYYYFWFEWEFWLLFETDVACTFYDTADTLSVDSPVTLNGRELAKDEYQIEELENNEKKVVVKAEVIEKYAEEGEKIEIALKPSLQVNIQPNQDIITTEDKFFLEGSVSNSDAKVFVNYNGEKLELAVETDGSFKKRFTLEEGANSLEVMAYEKDADEPFARIKGNIEYQKEVLLNDWIKIVGLVIAIALVSLIGLYFLVKRGSGKNKESDKIKEE